MVCDPSAETLLTPAAGTQGPFSILDVAGLSLPHLTEL